MAGRVGLSGMESDVFRNRFFDFGHSGYFLESPPGRPDFMNNIGCRYCNQGKVSIIMMNAPSHDCTISWPCS